MDSNSVQFSNESSAQILSSGLHSTALISGHRSTQYTSQYQTREYDLNDRQTTGRITPVLSEIGSEVDENGVNGVETALDYTSKERLLEKYGEKHSKERTSSRSSRRV